MLPTRATLRQLDRAAFLATVTDAAMVLRAHGVAITGEPASWPRWLAVEVVFLAARRGWPW